MSDLDKSSEQPSKDHFAELMADAIRRAGETTPIRYDAEEFRLIAEGEGNHLFNLGNVYREYCAAAEEKRPEVLRRNVRSWFSYRRDIPSTLEDACPDLLPTVRSRAHFELSCMQLRLQGMEEADWPYRALAEHLGIGLVYDLPDSMVQLQQRNLTDWRVSFEEALAAACLNLAEISGHLFEKPEPGVWVSPWRDNHDAARLLLLDLIRAHEVRGEPVAMVPNRDTLLLTGSEDDEGLAQMATLAEKALENPRPISGAAVRLEGDSWVPFLPDSEHPAHSRFRLLAVRSMAQDYAEQSELLKALHDENEEDVFVASFTAMQQKESGRVRSYCVWSEGIESLLPRTEEVFFFRPNDEGEGEIVAGGEWERVLQAAGHLMEPLGIYPERYRVKEFPTGEQLTQIGRHGL
jgi:hypothetical protein